MVHFYRSLFMGLGALCVIQTGTLSFAEGLDIKPIALEILSDNSSGTELFIVAVAAPSSAAPVIEGILVASANRMPAAVRTSNDLPQPSVILGFISPGQESLFGLSRLLLSTVASVIFSLDDFAAREALRASDPVMFKRLIEEGHVDPDPFQLNRILQIELKRMNCYRSGVDGEWGRGSRRSVVEYFGQLRDVAWEDPSPSAELFRALLLNGNVTCTAPVRVKRTQSPSSTRSTSVPKATAKPALSLGLSSGVFR